MIGGRIATLDLTEYFEDDNRTNYTIGMYKLECWFASKYNGRITKCGDCPFPDCVHMGNHIIHKIISLLSDGRGEEMVIGETTRQEIMGLFNRRSNGKKLCKV